MGPLADARGSSTAGGDVDVIDHDVEVINIHVVGGIHDVGSGVEVIDHDVVRGMHDVMRGIHNVVRLENQKRQALAVVQVGSSPVKLNLGNYYGLTTAEFNWQ